MVDGDYGNNGRVIRELCILAMLRCNGIPPLFERKLGTVDAILGPYIIGMHDDIKA